MDTRGRRVFASITTVDPIDLRDSVVALLSAGVDGIHVDIADGHFVPFLTFGPTLVESLRRITSCFLEVHLLVDDPELYLPALVDCRVNRIAFHVEATRYPWRVMSALRQTRAEVGIAINAVTPLANLEMVGRDADFVLALATDHTLNGDEALPGAVDRLRRLRAILPPAVRVEVDGGVATQNVAGFVAAGADDVVIGRALVETSGWGATVGVFRSLMQGV
jgi:ribulose-phosphate 3-epimerase